MENEPDESVIVEEHQSSALFSAAGSSGRCLCMLKAWFSPCAQGNRGQFHHRMAKRRRVKPREAKLLL